MSKIDIYVNEVLSNIIADENMKERIKSDLYLHLREVDQRGDLDHILKKMGNPKDVSKEFMDSIYEDKTEIIDKLLQERIKVNKLMNDHYEYKSKFNILGLPLLHIKINKHIGKPCVAKGIIAIGTVSIGIFSIGAVPIGIITIGSAAIGVISFGGLAIGLLLAVGGVSIGSLAIGGLAVGFGAIGGCALGKIAIGGYAKGTVAIGANTVGKYCMNIHHLGLETKEAVHQLIKTAYPNLPEWIINFFSSINISIQ